MPPNDDPRITWVLQLIERELAESDLSLREVAGKTQLSESRLAHLFKRAVGMPFQEYVRRQRIFRALRLLSSNVPLPVKEVAGIVRFSNPRHFARVFKRIVGQSPSAARSAMAAGREDCPGGQSEAEIGHVIFVDESEQMPDSESLETGFLEKRSSK